MSNSYAEGVLNEKISCYGGIDKLKFHNGSEITDIKDFTCPEYENIIYPSVNSSYPINEASQIERNLKRFNECFSIYPTLIPDVAHDSLNQSGCNTRRKYNLKYFSAVNHSSEKVPTEYCFGNYGTQQLKYVDKIIDINPVLCDIIGSNEQNVLDRLAIDNDDSINHSDVCRSSRKFPSQLDPHPLKKAVPRKSTLQKINKKCKNKERTHHIVPLCDDLQSERQGNTIKSEEVSLKLFPNEIYLPLSNKEHEKDYNHILDEFCNLQPKNSWVKNESCEVISSNGIEELGSASYYEPVVFIPKPAFCLYHQMRNRRSSEINNSTRQTLIDIGVGTASDPALESLPDPVAYTSEKPDGQVSENRLGRDDSALTGNEIYNSDKLQGKKDEFPPSNEHSQAQDQNLTDLQQSKFTIDNQNSSRALGNELSPQMKSSLASNDVPQMSAEQNYGKEQKVTSPTVHHIKYEDNMNEFGVKEHSEGSKQPYFKITKTVTFRRVEEQDGVTNKALGIDSWIQTDGKCDDKKSQYKKQNNDSSRPNNSSSKCEGDPKMDQYYECAKICCECLKAFINNKVQSCNILSQGNVESDFGNVGSSSGSNQDTNRPGKPESDLLRFLTELFLDAIPKEVYCRMMEINGAVTDREEEYEMRIKSYDSESTESCNRKNCKMLASESNLGKSELDARSQREPIEYGKTRSDTDRNTCCPCISEGVYCNNCSKKLAISTSRETSTRNESSYSGKYKKKQDEETYDCQITMNNRKILVKVNKSVEDLLLSGNIHNVRLDPWDGRDGSNKNPKENRGDPASTCCSENIKNFETFPGSTIKNISCNLLKNERNSCVKGAQNTRGKGTTEDDASSKNFIRNSNTTETRQNTKDQTISETSASQKPFVSSPTTYRETTNALKKANNLFLCNIEVEKEIPYKLKSSRPRIDPLHMKSMNKPTGTCGKTYNGVDNQHMNRTAQMVPSDCIKAIPSNRNKISADKKNKHVDSSYYNYYRERSGNSNPGQNCLPLYWDSQCMKYCDRLLSKDEKCLKKANVPEENKCWFMNSDATRKEMIVTPSGYNECEEIHQPNSCFFKLNDSSKYEPSEENEGCRDYTVASMASINFNTNPFDGETITCRKCIETLRSCAQGVGEEWVKDKKSMNNSCSESNHPMDLFPYCCNYNSISANKNQGLPYPDKDKTSDTFSRHLNIKEANRLQDSGRNEDSNQNKNQTNGRLCSVQDKDFQEYNHSGAKPYCLKEHEPVIVRGTVLRSQIHMDQPSTKISNDRCKGIEFTSVRSQSIDLTHAVQFPHLNIEAGSETYDAEDVPLRTDRHNTFKFDLCSNNALISDRILYCKHLQTSEMKDDRGGKEFRKGIEIKIREKTPKKECSKKLMRTDINDQLISKTIPDTPRKSAIYYTLFKGKGKLTNQKSSMNLNLTDEPEPINKEEILNFTLSNPDITVGDVKAISLNAISPPDNASNPSDMTQSLESFGKEKSQKKKEKTSTMQRIWSSWKRRKFAEKEES